MRRCSGIEGLTKGAYSIDRRLQPHMGQASHLALYIIYTFEAFGTLEFLVLHSRADALHGL